MNKELKIKEVIPDIIMHLILIFVFIVTLYPFVHMLAVSLSQDVYILQNKVSVYPIGINLKMYKTIFNDGRILTSYGNTILYTVVGTATSLAVTFMGAYALSKTRRLLFFKFFNFLVILPMFFSGGMIPLYIVVKNLNMIDTIWAVVLPAAVAPWYILIMRSFFQGFPQEIEESGMIEGLNDIKILWYLVLPLSKASLATIGLFYAVSHWNAFFNPFIFLNTQSKYPLQVLIRSLIFVEQQGGAATPGADRGAIMVLDSYRYAAIIITVLPIIMIYPFIQKYFVKGVMVGSLKG